MGMFDTFKNEDGSLEVQLKNGPCLMDKFTVGDWVPPRDFEDAVYHGLEGVVVIRGGKVVSVTETAPEGVDDLPSLTKWGDAFYPKPGETLADRNPIVKALKALDRDRNG
jgi:hypothetical protein